MHSDIHLEKVDHIILAKLKQEALKRGISVNALILELLSLSLGLSSQHPTYHDLDHLAGTWSNKEKVEFQKKYRRL